MKKLEAVALNAVFLGPRMGGLETYVRSLVPALMEVRPKWRFAVFVGQRGSAALAREDWAKDVELITHPLLGRPGFRAISELTVLGPIAARRGIDVLHSVAMMAPLRSSVVSVLTVPDLIWIRHPEPAERWTVRLWRVLVPLTTRRADRVITLSQASAADIVELLGARPEKLDVIPLGPGREPAGEATTEQELRSRLNLGEGPVVLAVSAKKVHKNLLPLVRAMRAVRERVPGAVLVIPGNPTPHERELRAEAERIGIGAGLRMPEWVSDADLEGLYALASCFAFPSLIEGFGLPVLEAMRRGVPVACAQASALPEVAGDAARYFDPTRPDDMAQALTELITDRDLAQRFANAGLARQSAFTWQRTAELTAESYERAWADRQRK